MVPPPRAPQPDDVVIVSALRTPLCRSRKGGLAKVPPSTLVETVFRATLDRTQVSGKDIEDTCIGNVLMPPSGFAAMRMAQVVAGIPPTASSLQMVNRQCSSGLQAVAHIASAIQAGQITIGIGGGVESMSFTPMYVFDGIWDVCIHSFRIRWSMEHPGSERADSFLKVFRAPRSVFSRLFLPDSDSFRIPTTGTPSRSPM